MQKVLVGNRVFAYPLGMELDLLATPDTAELLVMFNTAAAESEAAWREEMDKKENLALWEAREGFHEHVEVIEWSGAQVLVRRLTGEEKWVNSSNVELLD